MSCMNFVKFKSRGANKILGKGIGDMLNYRNKSNAYCTKKNLENWND